MWVFYMYRGLLIVIPYATQYDYIHSAYVTFGIRISLEMIKSIQEDVHRLYANSTPL